MRRAYVIGALWNGENAPPEGMDSGSANRVRSVSTPIGTKIEFNDGAGSVRIETPGGHVIVLSDQDNEVAVNHANGSQIVIGSSNIEIDANASVNITASSATIEAPVINASGVLQCESLVANTSVVSPVYAPGAGNIW